jgi:Transposase DDE domain
MSDAVVDDPLATLAGQKHVAVLEKHLRHLRKAYRHGNRTLFYDELVSAYLLAFFNPTLRSLRAIEDFSSDPHRHPRRLCRSTMSDANALMDARLLEPLIRQLQARLPQLRRQDGQLARLLEQVELVDGSFFASAATVVWALRDRKRTRDGASVAHSHVRLDLRINGATLLPTHAQVSGKGHSEATAACAAIERGVIYIADRGFENFKYMQELLAASADFVLRLTGTPRFAARQNQPLDADDVTGGVLSDRIGRLSGSPHTRAARTVPQQELREVVVFDARNADKPIRLLTSMMDVPPRIIALLYQWRWQIELFFRWLKVHAHFEHLISRSKNGMTLGFYVAVIAVLLMYLRTGRPMSKYAFNLLSYVAAGCGTIETTLAILERREKECERERQRYRARRAAKKNV